MHLAKKVGGPLRHAYRATPTISFFENDAAIASGEEACFAMKPRVKTAMAAKMLLAVFILGCMVALGSAMDCQGTGGKGGGAGADSSHSLCLQETPVLDAVVCTLKEMALSSSFQGLGWMLKMTTITKSLTCRCEWLAICMI